MAVTKCEPKVFQALLVEEKTKATIDAIIDAPAGKYIDAKKAKEIFQQTRIAECYVKKLFGGVGVKSFNYRLIVGKPHTTKQNVEKK